MSCKLLHIGSSEWSLTLPQVMGIINVTPDSFYAPSRVGLSDLLSRAESMLSDGAAVLDIGGCSTRPGATHANEQEEWSRLEPALRALRQHYPETILSLDTYRPEIAKRALEQFGPMIINDITGGNEEMYSLVRTYKVPYILTGKRPTSDMNDIQLILDPGFGFLASTKADFKAMKLLHEESVPLLVGVSRKSLIWKTLNCTPDDALSATQALHMYALIHGADILRVHDVKEARQTIELYEQIKNS